MLAPTSLAGRRLVVVMPVAHERAEGLQAFQTMAQMLLFGARQEHIEFRDNLAHSLYRDMRILRICHANRQKALRLRRRPSPPSYGALQSLPGEWLAYSISYFHARRAIPESHDSSLRRIISRCHAIVVKKKVDAQRVDNSYRLSIHFFRPLFNWSGVCAQRPFTGTTFDFGAMLTTCGRVETSLPARGNDVEQGALVFVGHVFNEDADCI